MPDLSTALTQKTDITSTLNNRIETNSRSDNVFAVTPFVLNEDRLAQIVSFQVWIKDVKKKYGRKLTQQLLREEKSRHKEWYVNC